MQDSQGQLLAVADHVGLTRESILIEWHRVVRGAPRLTQGDSLPRSESFDHLPRLLTAFEKALRQAAASADFVGTEAAAPAAAHGLQRWQQGYDLRELTRELGQFVMGTDNSVRSSPRAIKRHRVASARLRSGNSSRSTPKEDRPNLCA
jgi:hypothetical protein